MSKRSKIVVRTSFAGVVVAGAVVAGVLGAANRSVSRPSAVSALAPNGTGGVRVGASTQTPTATKVGEPIVQYAVPAISPPLRDLTTPPPGPPRPEVSEPAEQPVETVSAFDPVAQTVSGRKTPLVVASFDGLTNRDNFRFSLSRNSSRPPDTTGDVGPNHYVEWINTVIQVYNKNGTPLFASPKSGEQLFQNLQQPPDPGHTDVCAAGNAGDPVVLYDQLADRWVLSQFGFTADPTENAPPAPPFNQCIAVSTTPDPTGTYCTYSFPISITSFNDYPKIGMRPDGYYFSYNMFVASTASLGSGVSWHDRTAMLACQTAAEVVFTPDTLPVLATKGNLMVADTDGPTMPPANEPEFYLRRASNTSLELWKFNVDTATPSNSTFSATPTTISIPAFTTAPSRVPQKDTANTLDVLNDRLMYRLAYRRWGLNPPPGIPANTESLVVNHSAQLGGFSAIRWYEIRNPMGAPPTLFQSGTYSPDGHHRWMGSAAQDGRGNLMIGYSVTGTDMYPSIRYAGRLVTDTLGQLGSESSVIEGGGPAPIATGTEVPPAPSAGDVRWGDYTTLSVDPVDDCTFWHVGEYYLDTTLIPEDTVATKTRWWRTRIGSFRLCSPTAVTVSRFGARWRGKQVAVSWRTASEVEILGFNVFRSVGRGPFRKLNRTLISAKRVGSARGGAYQIADPAVKRSKTYTYRLQMVSPSGKRTWYGVGAAAAR
jgi:hypothetical protein